MATNMKDDGLGEWIEQEIDGSHVEWRRRESQADEVQIDLGGSHVIDISIDGNPPVKQFDFNEGVDQAAELELRVKNLKQG